MAGAVSRQLATTQEKRPERSLCAASERRVNRVNSNTDKVCMRLLATWLYTLISFGAVVTLSESAAAQTLRERARQSGGEPVISGVLSEIFPKSIEELAAASDVVVIAMLEKGKTSLTADENYIYTEYGMSDIHVVAGDLPPLSGPLAKTSPHTLVVGGGEMMLEGVLVRSENYNLRELPNGQYVLFLTRSRFGTQPGAYQIYHGGVFAIESDKVRGVVAGADDIYPGVKGTPVGQLVSRIQNAAKRQ
jgi:hypothetical protein